MKEISVFGLVHKMRKAHIREKCMAQYPRLQHDLRTLPEEKGLLSLIGDQLIDLDFLKHERRVGERENNQRTGIRRFWPWS